MGKHKLSQILAIVVIFSLISGCGSRAPAKTATPVVPPTATAKPATATLPPPTPAPTATSAPTATPLPTLVAVPIVPGSFPVGTYLCEMAADKYTWNFHADGTYNLSMDLNRGGSTVSESLWGAYTVAGDQITLNESSNPGDCPGKEISSYTWSLDGQTLRFKTIDDQCGVREFTYASCKWVVKP
jgi:hypothetical protein